MGQRPDEIERLDPMTGRGADPVGAPDPGSFGPESTSAGLPASESPTGGYATDISWGAPADTGGAYAGPADDGAGVTDADDEIGATRAQIEQTRANMSETIDAIQEKLSPSNLVQGAKDSVREATIGKASQMVSDAGDTVQEAVSRAGDTAR
ncbi:MAG: DUF3618 domain-containing protein, partial [Chloroflexi bacterium]|nr:DUF3618 domain-containing protein [Chloroflexota bacterium]